MATTHTVVKGDTLWSIAEKYLGSGTKYKQLAAINNISNPDLIHVGQVIKLTSDGSSTSSTSSSSNKPTINQFGLQSDADKTLFATWSWSKSNTASYKVLWTYNTGDGVWFKGNESTITVDKDTPEMARQSTYNIPDNATSVRFKVKPISEKKKSKDKEVDYWTANWSDLKTYNTSSLPPVTPATPSVTIEKYTLTAELDNLDENTTSIQFQIIKDNAKNPFKTATANVTTSHASYSCVVTAGGEYKVRCRAYNSSNGEYSDWSAYSNNLSTMPAAPSGFTTYRANSETSVYLEWAAVGTAKTYDIEYATKKDYFDGSDQTTTKSGIEFTHYEITGLETGSEYFFRLRAVNTEGASAWSSIVSVVIGTAPSAPTTWSSTTTVIVGEPLILYWVHNTEDGSSQTYAELEIYADGFKETHTIKNSTDEEEKDRTSSYTIDTSKYAEGTQIQWRVRTRGITNTYGDWSVQRTVDVYAPATLELRVTDVNGNSIETLTAFPFYVYGIPGPNTQTPIGYQLSVISNEVYETSDNVGNVKMVNAGEAVYSQHFDTNEAMLVELSAGNIDLENNINYTVVCVVSMNSGLTAESSADFTVTWTDLEYQPNASIGVDPDTWTAYIQPYCEDSRLVNYQVTYSYGVYTKTDEVLYEVYGTRVNGAITRTGEKVYSGVTGDGASVYYCTVEENTAYEDVLLSVYRREFDGRFVELAVDLEGAKHTTITDPHPALDYARYRIVAKSKTTGAISFYDPPGYSVGGKAVIIQWDEQWSNFDNTEDNPAEQPPWSGSLLSLPYNIDVSDTNNPDVEHVEYIGRVHPVSYYGTHVRQTATWNVTIERDDEETLYALRRLANWMGDVYIREPSGSGYWANVKVSFNQKHRDMTIPVTLNITRVEGGV